MIFRVLLDYCLFSGFDFELSQLSFQVATFLPNMKRRLRSGFMNTLVTSPKTGDTYIFKGSQMWVFDRKQKLYDNFTIWSGHLGLPYGPDAAFVYNGHIVLKQDKYWILQEEPIQIPEGYPQPVNSTCESFKNLKNRCILWIFRK